MNNKAKTADKAARKLTVPPPLRASLVGAADPTGRGSLRVPGCQGAGVSGSRGVGVSSTGGPTGWAWTPLRVRRVSGTRVKSAGLQVALQDAQRAD